MQAVQYLTETAATSGNWRTTLLTTGFRTGYDSGSTKPVASSSSARLVVAVCVSSHNEEVTMSYEQRMLESKQNECESPQIRKVLTPIVNFMFKVKQKKKDLISSLNHGHQEKNILHEKCKKRTKYYLFTLAFPCKYLHKSSESVKFKGLRSAALYIFDF